MDDGYPDDQVASYASSPRTCSRVPIRSLSSIPRTSSTGLFAVTPFRQPQVRVVDP